MKGGIEKNGKKITCEDCMDLLELVLNLKNAMEEGSKTLQWNIMWEKAKGKHVEKNEWVRKINKGLFIFERERK